MTDAAFDTASELRGRLKWFLFGRVAVISFFLAIVAASYLQSARERYDVPVQQLMLVVALTYAFSAVSALLLPHSRRLRLYAVAQIGFDVLLVTGVIYLTGGVESPFPFLYSLPIINAAVLLFGEGALFAAVAAALAYDGLLLALASFGSHEGFDLHVGMRIGSANLTFGMIAFLASILTRRLDAAERLLREKQAERDHFALLQDTLSRTINSGLLTIDADGRITSADAVAAELAGRPAGELVGEEIGAIFAPLRQTAASRLAFLQSSAASGPVEFLHGGTDERPLQLRCVAAPLASTFGFPIGALYVLQNVTELKEELAAAEPLPPDAISEDLSRFELDSADEVVEAADGLYGVSPGIARIRDLIDRVAGSDATVLIAGESGTGKEVVARAMHARGPRRDKRFVAINCGAIPENLIESELFGHVRGAFTGAVADRPGCFRQADGGTLFLDEIGELPLHLQVKLLRVLQERTFRPVGGETNVAVDVRIVAATNRDLHAQVQGGQFREDLYYRLNVICIDLPPLRERREDIPLLIRHFLRQFSDMHERRVCRFSVGAGRVLLQHHYPGNIRELENIVEHAVALCDGDTATEEHLPLYLTGDMPMRSPAGPQLEPIALPSMLSDARSAVWPAPPRIPTGADPVDLEADLAAYEKAILLRALDQAGGVKKRAAELLGINYRSLRHRLQKYGLSDAYDDQAIAS